MAAEVRVLFSPQIFPLQPLRRCWNPTQPIIQQQDEATAIRFQPKLEADDSVVVEVCKSGVWCWMLFG